MVGSRADVVEPDGQSVVGLVHMFDAEGCGLAPSEAAEAEGENQCLVVPCMFGQVEDLFRRQIDSFLAYFPGQLGAFAWRAAEEAVS